MNSTETGPTLIDVFLMPAIFISIGFIVFYSCIQKAGAEGRMPKATWAAYVITAIGVLFSFSTLWKAIDPQTGFIFRASIVSKKLLLAHYFVFPVSLACLIGLVIWQRRFERAQKEQAY